MPKYAELKRELRKAGCKPVENSKHQHWHSPITNKNFPVSHHDQQEVPKGTEKSIREAAGVPKRKK